MITPNSQVLRKNSKSFYFASLFLSKKNFNNCVILYEFCRKIDDIADRNVKNKEKRIKLILCDINNQRYDNNLAISKLSLLINGKIINKVNIIELLTGVLMDTKKVSIKDVKELINYSYLVAGTVGIMMAKLLGSKEDYSFKFAADLGIAMQLTNIMRDLLEDASINRVYYPKSWINIEPKEILEQSKATKLKLINATENLNVLANIYYKSAMKGLGFLPTRSRFSILLALLVYKQIGINIIKKNYINLKRREVVSFLGKIFCFLKAVLIFIFYYKLHKKSYFHNDELHKHIKKNLLVRKIFDKQ